MSRILAIAWKDLRSTMRNVPALAMMLLAPLALAALLGFAFGGGQSFSISATKVAVANADAGDGAVENAGAVVVGVLKSPGLKDIITVSDRPSAAAARASVDDGKAAAAVVIPAGFSSAIFGAGATASKTAIEVYENPTQQIGGAITESIVGQALLGFNGARAAATAAAGLATANGDGVRAGELAQKAAAKYFQDGGAAAGVSVAQRAAAAARRREHQGRRRDRHHPRRHDDLLHVLRRQQRGPHHPRRGPRGHAAAAVHHADAATARSSAASSAASS